MNRRTAHGVVVLVVVAGVAVAALGAGYVLPEDDTTVHETDEVTENVTVLKNGTFQGVEGHDVSGTVSLRQDEEGYYLYFQNYEQTQGPDVFIYLTNDSRPTERTHIYDAEKVLIDGGADGGESTVEGTFVQRLPDDVDPSRFDGIAVWCDDFSIPFGYATLEPAD